MVLEISDVCLSAQSAREAGRPGVRGTMDGPEAVPEMEFIRINLIKTRRARFPRT